MGYQILVSNNSGMSQGEIIAVVDMSRQFSPFETMQAFIANGGGFDDWSRKFSLVIGTDKPVEDMLYLNEYKNDQVTKKHYFIVPQQGTQEFNELYQTGEIRRTTSEILKFIGVR